MTVEKAATNGFNNRRISMALLHPGDEHLIHIFVVNVQFWTKAQELLK
jgi:hypothetical protein